MIYADLHEQFGWTRQQVDVEDLAYIMDMIKVRAKVAEANLKMASQTKRYAPEDVL